jgi:hypothetical protein
MTDLYCPLWTYSVHDNVYDNVYDGPIVSMHDSYCPLNCGLIVSIMDTRYNSIIDSIGSSILHGLYDMGPS